MARPEGFEPTTPRFVVWCSIQLSYGREAGGIAARFDACKASWRRAAPAWFTGPRRRARTRTRQPRDRLSRHQSVGRASFSVLALNRAHWGLHHVRYVSLGEDRSGVRAGAPPLAAAQPGLVADPKDRNPQPGSPRKIPRRPRRSHQSRDREDSLNDPGRRGLPLPNPPPISYTPQLPRGRGLPPAPRIHSGGTV